MEILQGRPEREPGRAPEEFQGDTRSGELGRGSLRALRDVARGEGNLLYPLKDAFRDHATAGRGLRRDARGVGRVPNPRFERERLAGERSAPPIWRKTLVEPLSDQRGHRGGASLSRPGRRGTLGARLGGRPLYTGHEGGRELAASNGAKQLQRTTSGGPTRPWSSTSARPVWHTTAAGRGPGVLSRAGSQRCSKATECWSSGYGSSSPRRRPGSGRLREIMKVKLYVIPGSHPGIAARLMLELKGISTAASTSSRRSAGG